LGIDSPTQPESSFSVRSGSDVMGALIRVTEGSEPSFQVREGSI
jgi:hypothetical protein